MRGSCPPVTPEPMTVSALRPRSVTEIVDAAFQVFRSHGAAFITCSAVTYVPALLVRLLVVGDVSRFQSPDVAQLGEFARLSAWSSLASVLGYALMTALVAVTASQAYLGETVDIGVAMRRVGARLPSLLAATAIVVALTLAGLVLLLAPAMYVTARYFAVTPAIMLEGQGTRAALARSAELSRGRKWHVLNTLGLVLLIYLVVLVGVAALSSLLGGFVVQALCASLVTILFYPVVAITAVLLYYDARIQREGLDIELMAAALDPVSGPALP